MEFSVNKLNPEIASAMNPNAGSAPLDSRRCRMEPTPSQIAAGIVMPSDGVPSSERMNASRARRSLIGMTVATSTR